jgi:hypothetical protein
MVLGLHREAEEEAARYHQRGESPARAWEIAHTVAIQNISSGASGLASSPPVKNIGTSAIAAAASRPTFSSYRRRPVRNANQIVSAPQAIMPPRTPRGVSPRTAVDSAPTHACTPGKSKYPSAGCFAESQR